MTPNKLIPMFQAVSLMEAIMSNRPDKEQALRIFKEMQEEVRQERIKQGQEMMQEQMQYMDQDEWSRIVD
jgi:hypothetical protein